MRTMACVVIAIAACEPAELADPDASGPSLVAIWDPRVCADAATVRVELRVEDADGSAIVTADVCRACRLAIEVPRIGWYAASAVALDAGGGGRALARATIAIDAPRVRWVVPWQE